ncbi:MAG: transposase [Gemmataceae bacterium]|nr:transposase [Gemmataceae bacterium]
MKLTLQLQLLPTTEQATLLLETMERCNAAASFAARVGFEAGVFRQPSIHARCYRELRNRLGLSSQQAVRAIGKAVEAFARDRTVCPVFRPHSAITYDQRLLSFKGLNRVSLLTVSGGRQLVALVFGAYQRERFDRLKGQADLVHRDGKFFLYCTIDLPEPPPDKVKAFVGVDLGIVQLATTSDGDSFSGSKVEQVRRRAAKARQTYQRRNTRNARRRLRKLARRQKRFQRDTNHCIAKHIVACAKDTSRGIVVEELTGIRARCTVSYRQRSRLHNWAFRHLRHCIEYKARLAGVPVVAVNPRDSSKTCSRCGHCERGNRKSQAQFCCRHCSCSCNADHNAALNLAARAQVNVPDLAAVSG